MKDNIVIVDYGMGNLHSVKKKLYRLNAEAQISSDPAIISAAGKLILPGVGHFSKAMGNLNNLGLAEVLNEFALVKKKPVLGICLGMQIMASHSEEGDCAGLNWFDADVVRFNVQNKLKYKVPHMGWNNLLIKKDSLLMNGITEKDEFYFVHSFHFLPNSASDVLSETEYEYTFCSAVEKDNIWGLQYHPEKSHESGELVLKNFLRM